MTAILVAGSAAPAASQWSGALDTGLSSRYEFRGVTRRNAFVWQVGAAAGHALGPATISAGGWLSFELTRASRRVPGEIGLGRRVGEWNAWLDATATLGALQLSAGWITYQFAREARAAALGARVQDTHELYASLAYAFGVLRPKFDAWLDVDAVHGAYLEPGLALVLPVLPVAVPVLRLGLNAGFSAGQERPDLGEDDDAFYFDEDGLTHVELFAGTQLYSPDSDVFYVTPELSIILGRDGATARRERADPPAESATKFVFRLTLSLVL